MRSPTNLHKRSSMVPYVDTPVKDILATWGKSSEFTGNKIRIFCNLGYLIRDKSTVRRVMPSGKNKFVKPNAPNSVFELSKYPTCWH